MKKQEKVAVCSRSFSKNEILRSELLEQYEHVKFNEDGLNLVGQSLIDFLRGYDKAITGLEVIDENILSFLPELKVIGKYGVGLNMIDMSALRKYGIRLGWFGGVNKVSVAELALTFAISLLRGIHRANREVLSGKWSQIVGRNLSGKSFGVIGCGHIGKELIRLLQPFSCNVLVHDILDYKSFYNQFNVKPIGIEDLLSQCDIVSLHIPLDRSTHNIIDHSRLQLMRSNSILINTSRGGLVDEAALKKMLIENKDFSAAFDVFDEEPPKDLELIRLPNFLCTPHIGGSSIESVLAMGRAAIRGLEENSLPQEENNE